MGKEGLSRASVDHICVSHNLGANVRRVGAWEGRTPDNCVISDHNGLDADIDTEFTATSIRDVRFSVLTQTNRFSAVVHQSWGHLQSTCRKHAANLHLSTCTSICLAFRHYSKRLGQY